MPFITGEVIRITYLYRIFPFAHSLKIKHFVCGYYVAIYFSHSLNPHEHFQFNLRARLSFLFYNCTCGNLRLFNLSKCAIKIFLMFVSPPKAVRMMWFWRVPCLFANLLQYCIDVGQFFSYLSSMSFNGWKKGKFFLC